MGIATGKYTKGREMKSTLDNLLVGVLSPTLVQGLPGYEAVDIGGGLKVAPVIQFDVKAASPETYDLWGDTVIKGEARLKDGRFTITSLTVEGPSVTGALLRSIPVQGVLRTAVVRTAHRSFTDPDGKTWTGRMSRLWWDQDVARHGPTPEALEAVATIYRLAYAVGDNPTKAVAEDLNLAGSTAGRWVMKARAAGLLGETQPGKAGA